jgi:hypothetical protein
MGQFAYSTLFDEGFGGAVAADETPSVAVPMECWI